MQRRLVVVWLFLAGLIPVGACAIEFRSIAATTAILYDAPSTQSEKRLILSAGYPVEVIIEADGWVRVRDDDGAFGWIEAAGLDARRTVMVVASQAEARDAPAGSASLVFRAERGVPLDFLGLSGGWAKVRHRSGRIAFIPLAELWGV